MTREYDILKPKTNLKWPNRWSESPVVTLYAKINKKGYKLTSREWNNVTPWEIQQKGGTADLTGTPICVGTRSGNQYNLTMPGLFWAPSLAPGRERWRIHSPHVTRRQACKHTGGGVSQERFLNESVCGWMNKRQRQWQKCEPRTMDMVCGRWGWPPE